MPENNSTLLKFTGRAYYVYQGKNHVYLDFASGSMEPNPMPGMEWALLE